MKKVLGIVISQRKLGNSEILVKEIMSSIPEDCSRELIRLTDLKLEPCKACYRCLQPSTPCPVKDDFNFVMGKIKDADAVVIGVPVYILGPHGYFKMLTDRLVGAENYSHHTRGKPCAIVIPYGTKRWEGYSKAAALTLPRFLKMNIVDCWQVHATLPGESLLSQENLEYARALGRDLFGGRKHQIGARECIFCGSDLFRLLAERKVECPICGARGTLDSDNLPDFSKAIYCRFSEHEMEEHFKVWLVEMKQRFLNEKDRLKEVQKGYLDKEWWIKP
ncbi:MAG: flavodoxin family protein [Syntrophomonadaceae bacterium]|nr:flavodoxin family protein [Syntrophomonadaceae bacterium]